MKMFCGREYFDLVLKQETDERLFLIIYCRSLVKTGENLDSFNVTKASRMLPSKMKKIEKLWKTTPETNAWTSQFMYFELLINNFKSGGHFLWVLDRQILSRQRVKMVRKLYIPLREIKKIPTEKYVKFSNF